MAAATVSGDSAMSNNPASRPDAARTHSFRAVNVEADNRTSSRSSDERASAAPQAPPQHSVQDQAARDTQTPPISRPSDRRPYDADTAAAEAYSSSPPAKRKRVEEPTSLALRTSADSNDAPIVIKTSPETQAREVIHLLSPERPSPAVLDASTAQYPGGHDSTSRTNEGSPWHPEQRRSETASTASRPPYNAYPNAQDESSVQQIDDSSDDDGSDDRPGHPHDDGRRPKRQFSHRTKTGCFTCRRRKKKCDEGKPACQNCIKGKFQCWGYGNKPVGDMSSLRATHPGIFPNTIRPPNEWPPPGRVPVNPDQPWHGPPHPPYMPEAQPPQNQYAGPPPPQPPPPPHTYGPPQHDARDPWARPYNDAAHIHLQGNKLGPVDYGAPLNIREYQPKDQPPQPHRPAPPPDPYMPHLQQGPPPPPPQYGHHFVAREGSHMSGGRHSSHLPPMVENERDKMLIGLPYRHWRDGTLIADRLDCKNAVDLYNRSALPSKQVSQDERANQFTAILNPDFRKNARNNAATIGRIGRCGDRTIVEAPFYCDYGYNLIIGSETVIFPNCYIQDPCEIIIGNRCIIGPNVKLYGMTASIDVKNRSGSQGNFLGGSIQIEDDCWIGGDVTILPYRIIGKGATVAAGSIVTRNVKPFTIVAGNPAKEVRSLDDSTVDRRMRTDIQQENEHMIEEMKRRRFMAAEGGPPGQQRR